MTYNREIDEAVRGVAAHWPGSAAKKMFGGICHLLYGNMVCGVYKDFLILRLGDRQARDALHRPHVKSFDITGRPMKGWVMVAREGFADPADRPPGWPRPKHLSKPCRPNPDRRKTERDQVQDALMVLQ